MAERSGTALGLAAFAAALGGLPAAAAGAERTVIPFEISELQHMVVALEINDAVRTTGVVDTAATFPMVDSRAVAGSGVVPPGPGAREVSILGVNGERTYPVVRIDSVDAGGFRFHALDAAYSLDAGVPGSAANILPAAAFPGDVLEFDFEARTLTSYDGRPDIQRSRHAAPLSYEVEGGLMFIPVRINGRAGRALIDTGSNLSYVNSAFAEAADLRRDDVTTRQLLGITGAGSRLWMGRARKVRLADFTFKNPALMVSDPVLLEELGLADEPVMVLGLDFLSGFRLQFDRRRQRLIFSVPADPDAGVGLEPQARATRLTG